jgi:hypothetical protein
MNFVRANICFAVAVGLMLRGGPALAKISTTCETALAGQREAARASLADLRDAVKEDPDSPQARELEETQLQMMREFLRAGHTEFYDIDFKMDGEIYHGLWIEDQAENPSPLNALVYSPRLLALKRVDALSVPHKAIQIPIDSVMNNRADAWLAHELRHRFYDMAQASGREYIWSGSIESSDPERAVFHRNYGKYMSFEELVSTSQELSMLAGDILRSVRAGNESETEALLRHASGTLGNLDDVSLNILDSEQLAKKALEPFNGKFTAQIDSTEDLPTVEIQAREAKSTIVISKPINGTSRALIETEEVVFNFHWNGTPEIQSLFDADHKVNQADLKWIREKVLGQMHELSKNAYRIQSDIKKVDALFADPDHEGLAAALRTFRHDINPKM